MTFDKKKYNREYRAKPENKRDRKAYLHDYYEKNKDRLKALAKEKRKNISPERKAYLRKWNKDNREKAKENTYRWNDKHKKRRLLIAKEDREKHREEYKARNYANRVGIKETFCQKCNSQKNLHFHHTDYITNAGITLCASCHKSLHLRGE